MDAKALLRRYLEQRRELGESELVLDTLQIDEVMRLLGAAGSASPVAAMAPPSPREIASAAVGEDAKDWRDSLRDAGVNVDALPPAEMPRVARRDAE
ncbi:MAG TPA: hypothetical protein VLJ83_01985, partial [Gemmatimonadaceae bacterium]|nr:hypothetical protein [Gemmatimonadaceae bacterium]